MKLIIHFLVLLLLGACSTLDKSQCDSGNWEHIGFVDGLKGRPLDLSLIHISEPTRPY